MANDRQIARAPVRRRLDLARPLNPMNMARAAQMIQAAARGFLVRRRRNQAVRREPERRALMSPMDIQRRFKRVRRPQGQVRVPKVFPKARIGSLIGTEVSQRKVTKKGLDPLIIRTRLDQNSTVSQNTVAYFGYPDAGTQPDQLRQACLALVNMFFRRGGVKVTTIDSKPEKLESFRNNTETRLSKIIIQYLHVMKDGTNAMMENGFSVDKSKTIAQIADDIKTDISNKARTGGQDVYWPVTAVLLESESYPEQFRQFAQYDLTNVMVDFSFKRKYKWQNTTPAGSDGLSGGTNINDIQANPLSGRIYKFKGPVPLWRDQIKNDHEAFDEATGANIGELEFVGLEKIKTEGFRQGTNYNNALIDPFRQPFKANQFFKNCETEDKVYMPPGGYKQLIREGKVTMNFKRFCQATLYEDKYSHSNPDPAGLRPPKIGTCTIWGLEPALRTATNEHVKLHVNFETWYTTKCRIGEKKQPMATSVIVAEGPAFGS